MERILESLGNMAETLRKELIGLTYDELLADFPHGQGCSKTDQLKVKEKEMRISRSHPYDISMTGIQEFLFCDECEVGRAFLGEAG